MPGAMEYSHRDVRESILERIFPDLRFGGDPDIDRYFELRSSGRMLDALVVYRARLRPRYPDDAKRIILLKLYRTRSPSFSDFLHGLLMERADEIVAGIRKNLDSMIAPLSGISMRNTYAVLKSVERIARLLPDDADAARRMAWDHADFAAMLGYRVEEARKVAFLLGEFYDQAAVDDDVPTDFIAASLASEKVRRRRDQEEEEKKNFFDLSRIEFDASDIRRIEIPSGLERDEDLVLAWCHKYWLRVDDPAFERIVWLYSKKYGTRHYEVFKAIKTGKRKKYQDDDILSMVATTIATRYSYTVQGDMYMQAAWRTIKSGLYGQVAAQRMAGRNTVPAKQEPQAIAPTTATQAEPPSTEVSAFKPVDRSFSRAMEISPLLNQRQKRAPVPETKAAGSVSDRIKRLSGRAYDVYKDIFLSKVRDHIRDALQKGRTKPGSVFNDDVNKAENAVYEFIERNYSNAYLDWPSSEHRAKVKELGFALENLDDIIESCYLRIDA